MATRELLVYGTKTFKISVPEGGRITFGPWSPPQSGARYDGNDKSLSGTLRIYDGPKSTSNIVAVFSGVRGFRDVDMSYAEEVAREQGAVIWHSDENGYERDSKTSSSKGWVMPETPALETSDKKDEEIPF